MILFFGAPGSGKSSQGQKLVERNDWQWMSTGDLFRSSEDPEVLKRLATGELIDDELTNKVLSDALQKLDTSKKLVLDGYPRNVDQAEWLLANVPKYGQSVECIIVFDVPRDELIHRQIGRGRSEDTEEIIGHRLDIYEEKTRPAIDFYEQNSIPVLRVDGTGSIEGVHSRVYEALETCLQPQ